MLAAGLLTVTSYHNLFVGTVVGFFASAALVVASRFPCMDPPPRTPFLDRLTRGTKLFWKNSELRGLMGLNLVVASTSAMVIINTVALVQGHLGRPRTNVALLLGANGAGSMIVALMLPRLLDRRPDRRVMLAGGIALPILLVAGAATISFVSRSPQWWILMVLWTLVGMATSMVLTPSSRLLRRNSDEQTRPPIFAAQFSLSHACFLITYPIAGIAGAHIGLAAVALVLAVLGTIGLLGALAAWRTVLPRTP